MKKWNNGREFKGIKRVDKGSLIGACYSPRMHQNGTETYAEIGMRNSNSTPFIKCFALPPMS